MPLYLVKTIQMKYLHRTPLPCAGKTIFVLAYCRLTTSLLRGNRRTDVFGS